MDVRLPLDDLVERRALAIWAGLRERMRETLDSSAEARERALMDDAEHGLECQRFLESRPVQLFMARLESNLVQKLTDLPLREDQERQRLAIAVQTVRQLQAFMLSCASTGRVASAELEKLSKGPKKGVFF